MFTYSMSIFSLFSLKFTGMVLVLDNTMDKALKQILSYTIDNTQTVSISEVIESDKDISDARTEIEDIRRQSRERINTVERNRTQNDPQQL